MSANILVADDEQPIADLVEVYLKNENYNVYKYNSGAEALACIEAVPIDLAVLDVMMGDMDGFYICRVIREKYFFPIIMLTAKVEDIDKITGLTLGADDYITKPFNPLELVARVKTQLRRYLKYNNGIEPKQEDTQSNNEYDFAGLVINKDTHKCTLYEKQLQLTPIEFSILWYLCDNKGRVISAEELFEKVWGEKYIDSNNTVMAHVARLREKMSEPSRKPKFIKTIWGVGYTIE
ncbi:MAG: VanR-ABDEGLN family response regulator transcription factor [Eubacteriaceae bacterium]